MYICLILHTRDIGATSAIAELMILLSDLIIRGHGRR